MSTLKAYVLRLLRALLQKLRREPCDGGILDGPPIHCELQPLLPGERIIRAAPVQAALDEMKKTVH